MKHTLQSWISRHPAPSLLGLFFAVLIAYLLIAQFVYAPTGYYGTIKKPRFSDPWFERTETILSGGSLYGDTFTTTPPITNYLMVPPSVVAKLYRYRNPGATVAFMAYFSLFCLFSAFVLLYLTEDRAEGWRVAALFLLNPLTIGNAVLRRQDESIITFFFILSLLLIIKKKHLSAAVSIGATLLVKLWGALLIPVALLQTRNWKYLVIPPLIFILAFSPFLITAGKGAMIWSPGTGGSEQPFQLGGISLATLWVRDQRNISNPVLIGLYALLVVGVLAVSALIVWKKIALLESISLLLAVILLLTTNLHAGYFAILAATMAPLLKAYRLTWHYFLLGALVMIADFVKFPIANYPAAFAILCAAMLVLIAIIVRLFKPQSPPAEAKPAGPASDLSLK